MNYTNYIKYKRAGALLRREIKTQKEKSINKFASDINPFTNIKTLWHKVGPLFNTKKRQPDSNKWIQIDENRIDSFLFNNFTSCFPNSDSSLFPYNGSSHQNNLSFTITDLDRILEKKKIKAK